MVDCRKMSFPEKKSVQIVYRRLERQKKRTPKIVEMRHAMSFSKIKLFALAVFIIGGGMAIPLIWFSLLGLPFMVKAENEKWRKIFPRDKNDAQVLLANQ